QAEQQFDQRALTGAVRPNQSHHPRLHGNGELVEGVDRWVALREVAGFEDWHAFYRIPPSGSALLARHIRLPRHDARMVGRPGHAPALEVGEFGRGKADQLAVDVLVVPAQRDWTSTQVVRSVGHPPAQPG